VPCLFAVDQAFPLPIVKTLRDFQADAELVAFSEIDSRLAELDDWEVLRFDPSIAHFTRSLHLCRQQWRALAVRSRLG